MKNWILRWWYQRTPRARDVRIAEAILTELGLDSDDLVNNVARELEAKVNDERVKADQRITGLLEANTANVDRRRAAEQAMRGMVAYAKEYLPENAAAFTAIVAANGIVL